jgi:DNA-binding PadR family transcriptional regulator
VYRELPVLVERGYIESTGDCGGKHHSQAYRITDAGRVRFAEWAATPIRNDMVRSATVLRLGFGVHLDVDRRHQIIEMARAEHELALTEHTRCAKDLRANGDHFAASAAEFAVEYDRAFLAWLDTVPLS